MNPETNSFPFDRWPLARVLILVLAGAFAGLMIDIRVEHIDVVREHSIAWLPIIYSSLMTVACACASMFWNKTTRLIMLLLFLVAFIIGGLGFYLHNQGHLVQVIRSSVLAWTDSRMTHSGEPPQLAPLAFAGLGVIGVLASLRQFNPERPVFSLRPRGSAQTSD